MSLDETVIAEIQNAFNSDPRAQAACLRAAPNGGAIQIVYDTLIERGYSPGFVQHLEVFYSFDPTKHEPSRIGFSGGKQPIRAVLLANNGQDVAAVNADQIVIQALCLPEVFPTRLTALLDNWQRCGKQYADEAEVRTDAQSRGLRVSLASFAGGPGDGGCKSSSCPGTPITR
ncbi:MAG: hypothetical protein ACT6T0_06355 [Nevskia sp.]|uniref:hypothetical protein n=1 Tax=Nevskia sp. TaxID=1929292 RepID=UPI0040354614